MSQPTGPLRVDVSEPSLLAADAAAWVAGALYVPWSSSTWWTTASSRCSRGSAAIVDPACARALGRVEERDRGGTARVEVEVTPLSALPDTGVRGSVLTGCVSGRDLLDGRPTVPLRFS